MPSCSNCGAEATPPAEFCPSCGAAVGAERHAGSGASAHADGTEPGTKRGGSEPARQTEAPEPARAGDQGARQRAGEPESAPRHGGSSGSGIGRRELLVGGTLAFGAVGGWALFLREESEGPVDVVEASWDVWEADDGEGFRELVHSESPIRETNWWNDDSYWEERFGRQEGLKWELEERTLVEETETAASIREVYIWDPPEGTRSRVTDVVELRTEDDEWKIWERENEEYEELEEEP